MKRSTPDENPYSRKTDIDKLKGLFDVYCDAFEEVHPFLSDVALQSLMAHPSIIN